MKIVFTKHAENKFGVLERHQFVIVKGQVLEAVEHPDFVDYSRLPLLIAQRSIDKDHVLRVVYKQEAETVRIITFYPGRRMQYEEES